MAEELKSNHKPVDEDKYQGLRNRHLSSKAEDLGLKMSAGELQESANKGDKRILEPMHEDALLYDARRKAIKGAPEPIPISNENLQRILSLRLDTAGDLVLDTIDSTMTIVPLVPIRKPEDVLKEDISVRNVIKLRSKVDNERLRLRPGEQIEMDTPMKDEFLKQFPVGELYRAFRAADEELKQSGIKKIVSEL
ncbi:MAG: hypothetical protein Q7S08_03675 [bacterium]|nr:hypothetical protein [bacterium]